MHRLHMHDNTEKVFNHLNNGADSMGVKRAHMGEFRKSSWENLYINHRSQFDNLPYRSKASFSHKHTHLLLIEEFYKTLYHIVILLRLH